MTYMNDKLIELLYKLKSFNKKFKNNKLRFVTNERVYNSKFFYTYHLQQCEVLKDSPYKDILFNYLIKSEDVYPGSSYYLVEKLLGKLNIDNIKNDKVKTEKNLVNFEKYLSSVASTKECADLFLNILKFSGPDATLTCKPTKSIQTTIIKKNNTKFDIEIHPDFRGIYFSSQVETTKQFIVSVIDVYVEKESEIMSLINYAHDQKMPVVLICRGISDLAAKSLKNIIVKNKIYVYPYIAKFDNEDPFFIKDITAAVDAKLFTLDAGDSLYADLSEKSSSKKLKLKPNCIEVFEINKQLVKDINKQIKNVDNETKNYLIKRKNRISPNIVEINIPKDNIEFISEIGSLIRCYNSCVIFGFLKDNKNNLYSYKEDVITDELSFKLYNTLLNIGYTIRKAENV